MLCDFLRSHRAELVERCRAKVASRMAPRATQDEMEHGIPVFLDQLIETLRLEQQQPPERLRLAQRDVPAEFSTHAAKHGQELLHRGFTLDQVVHDYGDLCQAVTELAIERDAPVSAREFHTLNRCLDQAIADAVTEYTHRRDLLVAEASDRAPAERLGNLAHEMRNSLSSAMLSFSLIKGGGVPIDGATSAIVDRSFIRMRDLIDRALADVRGARRVASSASHASMARSACARTGRCSIPPSRTCCKTRSSSRRPAAMSSFARGVREPAS